MLPPARARETGARRIWRVEKSLAVLDRTVHMHKMIRKITYSLGRHVSAVAYGTTQVRRLLHGAYVRIQPSVQEALMEGRPVIALESTIITHGMGYPQNLSMAREVEEIVTTNGAVPATVGILRGRIHVGLTDEELEFLASNKNVVKVSRRDLPFVLSQGLSGGTTVSGTMIAAHKAGIPVFVTGGIGGVHRGGENTLDVSADLTELGRTPVAVVSAGVKSILDIGRTLEYLETQGVCVAAFGESREFPAFFSRQSGFQAPYHVRDEEETAELIASALGLGLSSGVLIAVPCPQERAASGQVIEEAIQQALGEARSKGITGKELTPFMLQKISELTDGKSLDSNLALIHNNARVGSRIAVALSKLQKARRKGNLPHREDTTPPQPVVIGGVNVDFIAKALNPVILGSGQTNAGRVRRSFGGVGRNLADCLSRLGQTPLFLSAVGKDEHSESVLHYCHHMDMSAVLQLEGKSTATYCAVITGAGELSVGLGDMDIHRQITEQYVSQFKENLCQAPLICIDGNVPLPTIQYVCQLAREWQLAEELPSRLEDVVQTAMALARPLLAHLHCVVVTLGAHGILLCGKSLGGSVSLHPGAREQTASLCATHYPAIHSSREEIVNVSGAGDSFRASLLYLATNKQQSFPVDPKRHPARIHASTEPSPGSRKRHPRLPTASSEPCEDLWVTAVAPSTRVLVTGKSQMENDSQSLQKSQSTISFQLRISSSSGVLHTYGNFTPLPTHPCGTEGNLRRHQQGAEK
ncbi:uncharacterized protein LOC104338287 isoform X4 [Opisthocomus hoazin]|uniref:uncharacterized protein LOC104338287 isoform X4 n=1 Tax=Opisthocomus hoazin TaxID=30419 RepID=UPI003F535561